MTKAQGGSQSVVIRASAGTGKTFQLTNRFLQLALSGVPLDTILATTFTRKAAGEILDRVLLRLAEAAAESRACAALAGHVGLPHLDAAACGGLLAAMIRKLHRLRISTLDSFFIQIARACTMELDLPPGWRIVDPIDEQRLRGSAVRKLLETHSTGDIVQLLHLLSKGDVARSVSRQIDDLVTGLYGVFEETSAEAWAALPRQPALDAPALAVALEAFASLDLTGAGKQWNTAHEKSVAAAAEGDWPTFLSKGIAVAILKDGGSYRGKPIPHQIVAAYNPLIEHGKAVLLGQFANQTLATYRLLERFDAAYREIKRSARAMRFGDVTRRLIDARLGGRLDEVFYRIDGQVSHLLLDEFQDTSPAQWAVLAPLAHRAAEAKADRSFFCVGDVKQAIYGWRGGVAEIFDQIESELDSVTTRTLNETWRSSPVVVDVVNRVFAGLATNPALRKEPANAARRWASRFAPHTTARPELAGCWRLLAAPSPTDDVDADHAYWEAVVAEIARLHRGAPHRSLGVLVRRNDAVARLIHLLRLEQIDASEEGGNPLTDSPAVLVILSALAMADHPGSTTARFHVAHSPLGAELGLVDHADDDAARTAAARIRQSLQEAGYGRTLYLWVRRLSEFCDARDVGRLAQLLELAYTYQSRATARTDDFIAFVEGTRVEDVRSAGVRVMTIHQAKGLEFDVVVLPELDGRLVGQTPEIVVDRQRPTVAPRFVLRYVPSELQPLLPPNFCEMFRQYAQRVAEEAFCLLYVAMTRAIHALHMIVRPSGKNEQSLPATFAGVLRGALTDGRALKPGEVAAEAGDPDRESPWSTPTKPLSMGESTEFAATTIRLASPPQRAVRGLQRQSPSRLEGGSRVRLQTLLRTEPNASLLRGSILHAWFEQIEWIDDGLPDDARLRELAEPFGLESAVLDALLARFRAAAAQPALRALLAKPSPGAEKLFSAAAQGVEAARPTWSVQRERRFAVRDGDVLLQGAIDRLVLLCDDDRPVAAEIVDFKTDEVPNDPGILNARAAFYQPQMAAYRRAAASLLQIDPARISARLAFTEPGVVRRV